jgi:hypothetical protein
VFEEWGCRKTLTFPIVKLLDFASRQTELEAHANPFAVLVLAHLQARATQRDLEARAAWKLRLVKRLYDLQLDADDLRVWFRCLGWLLDLPEDRERLFRQDVFRFEEERKVTKLTNFERVWRDDLIKEFRPEILKEGRKEGLLQGLEGMLDVKFGAEGLALMPMLRTQTDLAVLEKVLQSIKTATAVEELRRSLPEPPSPSS